MQRGEVAVVTGGARGIGLAVVRALAERGVSVACVDQPAADTTAFEEVCRTAGVGHASLGADVRDQRHLREVIAEAAALGPVRYAVNCAGVDDVVASDEVSAEAWERVLDVDLDGVLYACQAEFALMREQGGAIVNVASMSGHIVNRGAPHAAYSAAKAGVIHLSKALGVEWAPHGVRVNSVSPGYTRTEMTAGNPAALNASFAEQTPMGRLAEVHEVAEPIVFLLGAGAGFVTAADLVVDGGFRAW